MKKNILMGASFLALLAAFPAFAAETTVKTESSTSAKIENSLDKAGKSIEQAADKTAAAAKDAYGDVKAYFTDDDNMKVTSSFNVQERNTAGALLGTGVQDVNGKDVGKIHDIIISKEGDAEKVIIEDGGVLGLGSKLVSFDYDVIEGYSKSQDVVVKVNEQSIKAATPFAYEVSAKDSKKMTTIPAGEYSVKKLLDAKVVGPDGKKVADVDTIAFDGDDAEFVIVDFDQIMGMGGEKAALNLDAMNIISDKDGYTFKLNSQQTAQFENYKDAPKAN